VDDNAVRLTPELLATMPSLPPTATIPRLPAAVAYHWGGAADNVRAQPPPGPMEGVHVTGPTAGCDHLNTGAVADRAPPFPIQEVATVTHFVHVRVCLDGTRVPVALRPYLVLFQELLLQTDLARPGQVCDGAPWCGRNTLCSEGWHASVCVCVCACLCLSLSVSLGGVRVWAYKSGRVMLGRR
jgi:hypothetical protein